MPTYRPSAQVVLFFRVDELNNTDPLVQRILGNTAEANQRPPSQPSAINNADVDTRLAELNSRILLLSRQRQYADDEPAFATFISTLRAERDALMMRRVVGSTDGSRPETLVGATPDPRTGSGSIIPIRIEVEKNGFRTADTAKIVLDFKDIPFDPRVARAAGVELVYGVVAPEDFEAGVRGEQQATGQLRSVIQQRPTKEVVASSTRFTGWVDDWHVSYEEENTATVELTCRDYTCLFLDTPLATGSSIDLSLPLTEGLRAFIDSYETTRGIPIRFGNPLQPDVVYPLTNVPIPGQSLPNMLRSRRGTRARTTRKGDQKMKLWDYITDICVQVGVIPIIKDYTLWLSPPRNLYSGDQGAPVRKMVWGRNLTSLEFTRKLGGVKVPTIEVRCYDPSIGRTRWGRYPVRRGELTSGVFGVTNPPLPLRANETGVSGARPSDKIETYTIRPTQSGTSLGDVAQGLYEQIGRQEIEGNFETSDVSSWDLVNDVPLAIAQADLLRLESGDSVELLVKPQDTQLPNATPATINNLAGLSVQARANYLTGLGWKPEVARKMAVWQEGYAFQTTFRVHNSRISFDNDEGMKLKVDFINYITIRDDQQGLATTQVTNTASAVALPQVTDEMRQTPPAPVLQAATSATDPTPDAPTTQARDASSRRRFLQRQRQHGLATDQQVQSALEAERAALRARFFFITSS